jgi:DNA-binding transcriptional MerR regulator
MAPQSSPKRATEDPTIPDRLYFKIGDVARICQVETYVLRFWETQFPQLKPNKSGTGQRLYRRRDVETALQIKRLVHGQGYTLMGARQAMSQGRKPVAVRIEQPEAAPQQKLSSTAAVVIRAARDELRAIAGLLAAVPPEAQPSPASVQRRKTRTRETQEPTDLLFPC